MAAPRGSEVWRDFVVDGIPSSGSNNPKKSDIRSWAGWLENLVTSGVLSSGPWFATKAAMTLAYAANTIAIVYNDPIAANNGLYIKAGASGSGSWTQLTSFLPGYQFVTASPTGASAVNAIVASTSPRLPAGDGVALVTLAIPATNTASSVTVRFDGGAVLTIKTRTGEDLDAGELQQNDVVAGFVSGATFRLISDLNSLRNAQSAKAWANSDEGVPVPATLGGDGVTTFSARHWAAKSEEDADRSDDEADRSEVARVGAESARDRAAGYVNDIVSEKEVPITATRNGMELLQFPAGMNSLETRGYAVMGDGGDAQYVRVTSEPPHSRKVRSLDRFLPNGATDAVNGGWWERAKPFLVILASGQSNIALSRAKSWDPTVNAWRWNNADADADSVGAAFVQFPPSNVQFSTVFADTIAKANAGMDVYVVNIGFGGREIAHWLPGSSAPDMYQYIKNNVEPALADIGASKIDVFLWWQGEADYFSSLVPLYYDKFQSLMARLNGEIWFDTSTSVFICGTANATIGGHVNYGWINRVLMACANASPSNRQYFYTSDLPLEFWQDNLHPNGDGYYMLGQMAAAQFMGRSSGKPLSIVVDPEDGKAYIGKTLNSDARLTVSRNSAATRLLGSPSILHLIAGDGEANSRLLHEAFGTPATYTVRRANGTLAAPTGIKANDVIKEEIGTGYNGSGFQSRSGTIALRASADWTPTSTPTQWRVSVVPSGGVVEATAFVVNDDLSATFTRGITLGEAVTMKPPGNSVPAENGQLTFSSPNDTTLTVRRKGGDGIVRSVSLTLA
ncbi:sialate O-acetylesterase [Agrobacterium tumefaciens]|uniref:sialate O-acetylesterase n=1 Tax=Agrobacterium tumefaciens TaxID=358 RepID=UPI003BA22EB5